MKKISVLTVLVFLLTVNGMDAAEKMIRLPLPQKSGGKSIMECLTLRRSVKSFLPEKKLCTDNAAMIGAEGYVQYINSNFADLKLNAKASVGIDK